MTHADADPDRTIVARIDPLLGAVLAGRYRLVHQLATGGFGAVYRALDLVTSRDVAVKVLHRELTGDPTVAARFQREAAALAELRDPHTVVAYDAGETADGTLYIVMELLSGESLHEHFRARGPLPWQRVVRIARGVCSSLAEAHAHGIVHRDLKPANIHLEHRGDETDFVKVLDFGIAKVIDDRRRSPDLTHVGQMIGTFDYMPAEQMMGGTCSPRTDVFTLGVVIYELIAGVRPYGEPRGPASMLAAVLGTIPPLLANVPAELARIVARCIEREPEHRYAHAADLDAELAALESPDEHATTMLAVGDHLTWIDLRPRPPRQATIPGAGVNSAPSVFGPGVAIPTFARGSKEAIDPARPRLASGTSPIANEARAVYPVARESGAHYVVWTVILTAFVIAAFLLLAYATY